MGERKFAKVGIAELSKHPESETIYSLDIGSLYITVWLDEEKRYAKMVSIHNANDERALEVEDTDGPAVWLHRA